jgi:hypothetical protein
MRHIVRLFILAVLCVTAILSAPNPPKARYEMSDVFVYDGKIIVEGKEFYMKGFNYSPQPLGMTGILDQTGGGLCSQKKNEEGAPQSACYLEDYFNGIVHPDFPDHGPWFKPIWDRDFAKMKDMGVNAIRVYHMNYITKSLIQKYPDIYKKYNVNYAAEHRTFFDVAHSYGIKIVCPVVDTETTLTTTSKDELKRFVEARVDEVGDHPALVMWAVGNELGLYQKPELRGIVNEMMDYLREYTLTKWNRIIPVTTVEVDLPMSYIPLIQEMHVDVFTSNCGYRDVFINSVWEVDTNPTNNMPGWAAITKATGIPLLVGEYGMHEQDEQTAGRHDWINQQIASMVKHKVDGGIGYLFFEWNEEHLKPENQIHMGIVSFAAQKQGNQDSTMSGVLIADQAVEKDYVYQAAKSGLPSSAYREYSYSKDVYELTETTQLVVDLSKITPKAFPTGYTQPIPYPSDYTPPPPPPLATPLPEPTVVPGESTTPGDSVIPATSSKKPTTSDPIPRVSASDIDDSSDSGASLKSIAVGLLILVVMTPFVWVYIL